ncbi:MAG: hypothetical protein ABIR24_05205 [Verrucomicrobiota bacterium]
MHATIGEFSGVHSAIGADHRERNAAIYWFNIKLILRAAVALDFNFHKAGAFFSSSALGGSDFEYFFAKDKCETSDYDISAAPGVIDDAEISMDNDFARVGFSG